MDAGNSQIIGQSTSTLPTNTDIPKDSSRLGEPSCMIGKMDLPSKKKEYSIRMMIELISEILVGKSACLFSDHCHGGL